MWNSPLVWQLAEEPSIEPIARDIVAFLFMAVSFYLTTKVLLVLGFTSIKTNTLLNGIRDATCAGRE